MTIFINLRLHAGCIGPMGHITGILGNFYIKRREEFLTNKDGWNSRWPCEAAPFSIIGIRPIACTKLRTAKISL